MRAKWTDLAVEAAGGALRENGLSRTVVKVENEESAQKLGRPMGTYITLACEQAMTVSLETRRALAAELAQTLCGMLPPDMKTALVVGLGNRSVTPDSLGPRTAERVLVTRHMGDCLPRDVPMSSVCAAAPGVLGVTGMETAEILRGMVAHVKPDAVIAVDALAARSSKRIASTIQITDTGISPGSGVGNHREGLNEENLSVRVIGIGVPTVVDAATIVHDSMAELLEALEEDEQKEVLEEMISPKLYTMFVTPKDVDETVRYLSFTISEGLNLAFSDSLIEEDRS